MCIIICALLRNVTFKFSLGIFLSSSPLQNTRARVYINACHFPKLLMCTRLAQPHDYRRLLSGWVETIKKTSLMFLEFNHGSNRLNKGKNEYKKVYI